MKNKLFKSIGISVFLLALLVSNVFAFSLGTTDGVWGRIDASLGSNAIGATCERYGAVTSPSYTLIDGMGVAYNTSVGPGGESERYIRNADVCSGNTVDDYAFATTGNPTGWVRDVPANNDTARWGNFRTYTSSCAKAESLIISRYVYQTRAGYGSSATPARLAIEIYNNTGNTINLSGYSLLLFTNDQEFRKIDLSGNLANGAYYVVGTSDTTSPAPNLTLTGTNGNSTNVEAYRTVALVKDYVYGSVDQYRGQGNRTTVYNRSTADENQVRYGNVGTFNNICPDDDGTDPDDYLEQSGFGFQGMPADPDFHPAENVPFPIGRFCHYNNPVSSSNTFNSVNLSLMINDLACPDGQTIVPSTGSNNTLNKEFIFTAVLDETTNNLNPCTYGPNSPSWPSYGGGTSSSGGTGLNRNGCADMVRFTSSADNTTFTCVIDPALELKQEYHLSIMGFTPTTVGADCPDTPVGTLQYNQVYTAEQTNNCFCMYAAYTKNQITPVTLASFGANWTENGVLIDWETVSETNNFGFNIMRAEIVDGERIQINAEMIFSNLAPGDAFGSSYEYLDETAVPGTEYFYWLVDVPLDSSEPGIYGPINPAP